ncbi:MAG: monosaccharide transporter ATP-binding protein family [Microbacterium sp.]|jgi:ABC-type sugar transport system ATPase subunit|nr:monosaccharide transporter ATP-binding protein family [Microbacterium sp.]
MTEGHANPVLLGARELTKTFGGAYALREVDVAFREGEVHALLGENGAGKSTLVKAISGVMTPDHGDIYGDAYEKDDVAMVFQELSAIPTMSILDNLALAVRGGRGLLFSQRKLRARAERSLARAGLDGLDLSLPAGSLSLAQRQLLEIARGLIADARVLILDEPTATLSDVEIQRVHGVVRELTGAGTAVVYITHRLGEVFELSDRVTIMRAGEVVASGPTGEFTLDGVVQHMLGAAHTAVAKEPLDRSTLEAMPALTVTDAGIRGSFSNVSLTVRAGEVTALFGQIGSGADAIARAVAGLARLDEGSVAFGGRDLALRSRVASQKEGIAYISPDRVHEGVFLDATVVTNITSGALPRVSSAGVIRRDREIALTTETVGQVAFDSARIGEKVSAFSGGNQQKVAVARALATQPRVLVLNEPTRGVDIGARSEIYRRIRRLAEDGVVVLVYSSDVLEIRELADVVVTLYRGDVIGVHEVPAVADSRLVTEILSGKAA